MMSVTEAVVLMAGAGSRLVQPSTGDLKPLTQILGRPLVAYLLGALNAAGIEVVHAVVGYRSEAVISQVTKLVPPGLDVRFIENRAWQKQNGLSVLAADGHVRSPFVLSMSDHLFDDELLGVLLRESKETGLNLAIDRKIEAIVDIADAMKVKTKAGRVISIGKELEHYDAIDTGLFVANHELFDHLKRANRGGDCSLADGVRLMATAGKVHAIDVGDAWWQDVDTPLTLQAARAHLRSRLTGPALAIGARAQD
jgi:choline kinase